MALTAKLRDGFRKYLPKHPREILVADEELTHFTIAHPKSLPWFADPVSTPGERNGHGGHQHPQHHQHTPASQIAIEQPNMETSSSSSLREKEQAHVSAHKLRSADGEPEFKRAHEASVIQLFYDLFFVANLTTFTSVHEINDGDTLKSYIGYFGILWTTWFQVALFDVRFSIDSVFERLCKGLQFGVMTGFAVVGPAYQIGWGDGEEPTKADQALRAFQTLSIILMVSRLILLTQYGVILFWLRKWRKAWVPIFLHMLVLFTAAMIFLGLFFSFGRESGDNSLIAWYVVVALEAAVILCISGKWKFLSFRKTVLVERLGLLTLIILGEGVIGLCLSIQKVGSDQQFGSDIIGMIICGVVIIYAQWMLYFDQTETERVGTVRQVVWAILHFPYHVTILLLVEGVSQISVWRKLVDFWLKLDGLFDGVYNSFPETADEVPEFISQFNETLQGYFEVFQEGLQKDKFNAPNVSLALNEMGDLIKANLTGSTNQTYNGTANYDALVDVSNDLFSEACLFAADNFGVEVPEDLLKGIDSPSEQFEVLFSSTFLTIYVYFFICAGLSLIFTSILFFFGKRHKVRGDFLNIFFRILMGLGLTLLAYMGTSSNLDYQYSWSVYAISPWVLPTVTIVLAIVVVVDNVLINYVRRLVHKHVYSPANSV